MAVVPFFHGPADNLAAIEQASHGQCGCAIFAPGPDKAGAGKHRRHGEHDGGKDRHGCLPAAIASTPSTGLGLVEKLIALFTE
jgi:hypothetical protein